MPRSPNPSQSLLVGLALLTSLCLGSDRLSAQTLQSRSQRWLDVREVRGAVTYVMGNRSRLAQRGDRLTAVGQGIQTGAGSRAVLNVDSGISQIQVAANTNLVVSDLSTLQDGGKVTTMTVTAGQARFQVRRFTHPSSRLEIRTPAAVSAVRGTEFGVTVSPISGKLGMATLEGAVSVSAQNQTVLVEANEFSTVKPGEPPTPPQPFDPNSARLDVHQMVRQQGTSVHIQAVTDPPNLVLMNDRPLEVDAQGRVDVVLEIQPGGTASFVVRNPIGKEQTYQLVVP